MNAPNQRLQRTIWFAAIAVLLALAFAEFAFQDVRRIVYPVNDLTAPWVASKAFLAGANPYTDRQAFEAIWAKTGVVSALGCPNYGCLLDFFKMAYPPTALALLAPLGMLSWPEAVYTYMAVSTAFFVVILLLLAQRLPVAWSDPRKWYLIAFTLALAPLHVGIHNSNPNTLVIACLIAGVVWRSERPYASGIAVAIALCMKPQVAIFFFAYPWLRRKWKAAFAGLVAAAVICSGTLLWLRIHHVAWVRPYLDSLSSFAASGGVNSFDSTGFEKFWLIDLKTLVYQMTHSPEKTHVIAGALSVLLIAASGLLIYFKISERNEATGIAILSVLTLLPVYQRYYTAAILVFVIYWAVERWPRWDAKAALVVMLPLLLPFVSMTMSVKRLAVFIEGHHLGSNPLWDIFVMPYAVWIELILLLILLGAALGESGAQRPVER